MKRILLVEDQNAFMIQALLELYAPATPGGVAGQGQFEFDIVNSGDAAIEKLAGRLPDLVLLDLRLPGVGGLAVLDAIRQVDSRLPVIIVSAYGDKCTRQEATRRGANDFFHKPFSHERLYRRMRELLATAPRPATRGSSAQLAEGPVNNGIDTVILRGHEAQLLAKYRRLQKLKEQQALRGVDSPPALLIEIEDLEKEIEDLERDGRGWGK